MMWLKLFDFQYDFYNIPACKSFSGFLLQNKLEKDLVYRNVFLIYKINSFQPKLFKLQSLD